MFWFSDYIIFIVCILFGVTFLFYGTERVYRFYLGMIIGFLLFLVANLEIRVLQLESWVVPHVWQDFLLKNQDFVLTLSSAMIPVFGFFFALQPRESVDNKVISLVFGMIIPIFLVGIFSFIFTNMVVEMQYLTDILSFFTGSSIYEFFLESPRYVLYLLFFIIFWRLVINFVLGVFQLIISEIDEQKDKKKED